MTGTVDEARPPSVPSQAAKPSRTCNMRVGGAARRETIIREGRRRCQHILVNVAGDRRENR